MLIMVSFKILVWFRNSISRRGVTRHLHFQIKKNERKNQNSNTNNTYTHTHTEMRERTKIYARSDLINNNGFDIHHIFMSAGSIASLLIHSMADLFAGLFALAMYRHQMLCATYFG